MAARSVLGRPLPDRPEALEDVISTSPDSDSDSESLPSVSEIWARMSSARPARTESIDEHSRSMLTGTVMASSRQGSPKNEAFARGNREISDPSSPNSPIEAGFPSSSHFGHPAKTSKPTKFVDGSPELTSSTSDQHNAGMRFSSCSPQQKTSMESVSSQRLFVRTTPSRYQGDESQHYQHTNSFYQTASTCTNNPSHPPRSHSPSIMSSNQCIPIQGGDADHGHGVVAMPPSDTNVGEMGSASTQVSRTEHAARALAQGNSAGDDQQESAHDTSPFATYPGLSSGKRRQESRQTTSNVNNMASRLEAPGDNLQSQLHGHRTPSGYNLRPSPVKRRYGRERLRTGKDISSILPRKRRKPEGLETNASVCQIDCLLVRWRKHIFLVKWHDHSGAIITTWEPRKNILDKRILADFEAQWSGFDTGLDVLGTRQRGGKRQYLLHWHGRSSKEDTWLNEDLLSPQLIGRIDETGSDDR